MICSESRSSRYLLASLLLNGKGPILERIGPSKSTALGAVKD